MGAVPFCPRVLGGREWFTLTLALSHRGRGDLREGLVGCPALLSPGSGFPPPYRGTGQAPREWRGVWSADFRRWAMMICPRVLGSRLGECRGNDVGGLSEPRISRISADIADAPPVPFGTGCVV